MKIYCVTDKELNFIENSSYTLAAVGKNIFNTKYLRCDFGDNIFYKEKIREFINNTKKAKKVYYK